jgi:hypothetical protein
LKVLLHDQLVPWFWAYAEAALHGGSARWSKIAHLPSHGTTKKNRKLPGTTKLLQVLAPSDLRAVHQAYPRKLIVPSWDQTFIHELFFFFGGGGTGV